MTYFGLHRTLQRPPTELSSVEVSLGRGRKRRLVSHEQKTIKDTLFEFQNNGTLLNRSDVMYLVREYVLKMSLERQASTVFVQNRPNKT